MTRVPFTEGSFSDSSFSELKENIFLTTLQIVLKLDPNNLSQEYTN